MNPTVTVDGTDDKLYRRKQTSEAAVEYLQSVAIDIPGKNYASKHQKPKKILPKRLKRLHRDFCKKNPEKKISLQTFYRKLPGNILSSRKRAFQQCLCEYCENIDLKLDALNKNLTEPVDGRDVLSEASTCPEPALSCLNRSCKECGIHRVRLGLETNLQTPDGTHVKWKCWEIVTTEKGKRRELITKEGTIRMLLDELMTELTPFSKHLFNFRWQFMQYKSLKSSLPANWALVVMDFAENFLCKYQNEVQSAHWGYNQVTVHPCVLYYNCPTCADLITDYLIFLSDDLSHDAHMVKVIQDQTKQHLLGVMNVEKMVVISDGCAAHYKSKLPFHHLSNLNDAVAVERSYFGSRHGKSPCDSCGGIIKRLVQDDIATGAIIQNAAAMFEHCMELHILPSKDDVNAEPCCHTRRSFKLIKTEDIDRTLSSASLQTLPGTRQLHSLKPVAENVLATRKLSCFCQSCQIDNPDQCLNRKYVEPWNLVKLKTSKKTSAALITDPAP